jgi:plastocyanin
MPSVAEATHAPAKTVGARNFQFEPPVVSIGLGDHLDFTNFDAAPHDVTATQTGPDGEPLFASRTVGQNITVPVERVETLAPGNYTFLCSVHPNMTGALLVGASVPDLGPAPDPGADPQITAYGLVATPTSVTASGNSLYAAGWAANTIYKLDLLPGGVPGPAIPYATGVSAPLGVVVGSDGTLFVADSHPAQTPGRGTAGRVWAIPPGGGDAAEVGEVVVDELPNGRHNTNGMAIRDGRLYITNGNSTDDGVSGGDPEMPLSGTLISVPLDARDVVVGQPSESAITVHATGMRNVYDVEFRNGTSDAWFTFNGPDPFDPWGEDLLLRSDVSQPSVDFGFPGCLYGAGQATPWIQNPNPDVSDVCDGTHKEPEQLMGLHVSADGLAFGPEGGFWDGDLFVAEWGNLFGTEPKGHRIVRVPVDAAGNSGPPEDLVLGGAPIDLTFAGGDMYIADFALGIVHVKQPPLPPASLPTGRRGR